MRTYAFTWILRLVAKVHQTYPRAAEYLNEFLGIGDETIAERYRTEKINWYRYKKLLRQLEDLLNACIVPVPGKVVDAWEICTMPLDTADFQLTLDLPNESREPGPMARVLPSHGG